MKKFLLILLALSLAVVFAACAPEEADDTTTETTETEDDWAYIQDKGTLVIGITIYNPMNYYDDDENLIGFDTEFAIAACEKLGLTAEFQVIDWSTKEIELQAKSIDCIWNGFTVSEERRENVDFSTSYIKNMQVAVIRAADAALYPDLASMADARLVAEAGSTGEKAIEAAEELADENYTALLKQTDALLEVKAGSADVGIVDYTLAKSMVGEGTSYADLMLIPDLELEVEEYAIGFRLGSTATEHFNQALQELTADGTMDEIAAKYGLTDLLISNQ